jgi:flagellar protein FliS
MLFDGLLERIAQTKGAMEQNNIELKGLKVNQAVSILFGLRDALDREQGDDLSNRLDGLYDYIQRQLWKAHMNNDTDILNECSKLTTEISDAWRDINPN